MALGNPVVVGIQAWHDKAVIAGVWSDKYICYSSFYQNFYIFK